MKIFSYPRIHNKIFRKNSELLIEQQELEIKTFFCVLLNSNKFQQMQNNKYFPRILLPTQIVQKTKIVLFISLRNNTSTERNSLPSVLLNGSIQLNNRTLF